MYEEEEREEEEEAIEEEESDYSKKKQLVGSLGEWKKSLFFSISFVMMSYQLNNIIL